MTCLILTQSAHSTFLWADKNFWVESHKGYTFRKAEVFPFASAAYLLTPPKPVKINDKITLKHDYEKMIFLVGNRVMGYSLKRVDGKHLSGDEVALQKSAALEINTSWGKLTKTDSSVVWKRSDRRVTVEYLKDSKQLLILDSGFWMLWKTYIQAAKKPKNGIGTGWGKMQKERLKKNPPKLNPNLFK